MIIFDLDGTLWDSAGAVAEAWSIDLSRQMGREVLITKDDIHGIMGLSMDEVARRLVPVEDPEERERLAKSAEEFENEYLSTRGGDLFPGVRETLEELMAAGKKMAIVSNCQEGYIPCFMKSMDMEKYFCDYEEWGRTRTSKGANIRLVMERNGFDKSIYIGDIQKDKDACDEAGVPCIYAAFGFGEIENPAATIEKFSELPAVLEELGF